MPEKDANLWGYIITGMSSIGGMLGFQKLLVNYQNKKINDMCIEVKGDIAKIEKEYRNEKEQDLVCKAVFLEIKVHITEEFKVFKQEILDAINGGRV